MTGQPEFTFRGRDDAPDCRACGEEMAFLETRAGTFHEHDVYGCPGCGRTVEDRWTF